MSVILWVMGLSLLSQACLNSAGETERGCRQWNTDKGNTDVCCDVCNPGNRLVKRCGSNPKDLCTPCEPDTYTADPTKYTCTICTQCTGVQVLEKACTSTTDTVCGCKAGLRCGDAGCSFCVDECGKGKEPAEKRSCRACPHGTFNDQIHQKCKPWTRCSHPEDVMAKGSAVSDISCSSNISVAPVAPVAPVKTVEEWAWSVVLCVIVISMGLIITSSIIIMVVIRIKKRKKTKKAPKEPPIIRPPTDEPRTLIAVECSFHEAQQEQGSSSESLASKDSRNPLIV